MPNPGYSFERLVAQIQQRVDPNARVTHSEFLVDRLKQRRQFDVVIRGEFGGQEMLGVIECKDLNKKVGTPEVDAFHTKAQDINANFKIIASRRGFTDPALVKAEHYGIKAISLLDPRALDQSFAIGDWWTASVLRWNRLNITVHPASANEPDLEVPPEDLIVDGCRVLDWFTNHLIQEGHRDKEVGWAVNFKLVFDSPIQVFYDSSNSILCSAISFHAERERLEYEKYVPVSADAFFDWHSKKATIPPNTKISIPAVSMDFRDWNVRDPRVKRTSCILPIFIEAHEHQFEHVSSVPKFENM